MRHRAHYYRTLMLLLLLVILLTLPDQEQMVRAEITSGGYDNSASSAMNSFVHERCVTQKYLNMVNMIDDVEDLELDVPVHIALDNRQRKRFLLKMNYSTPLTITFSNNVARKIYFNATTNLIHPHGGAVQREQPRQVLLPCALRGEYDIFLQARQRGSIKIEAHAGHPQDNWPLLNRTHRINIRSQNRVRKRQMIVKWERSKFDFYAMHYCLVVNTWRPLVNFCDAVNSAYTRLSRLRPSSPTSCNGMQGGFMDFIWSKSPERSKKIDPHGVNIICSGSRTQQLLRGLVSNTSYYLDVFGVHTRRQNLTFHMGSNRVHFSRTHPATLVQNSLSLLKISGLHGVQVFSFKVPSSTSTPRELASSGETSTRFLRYLILPCGGSELNVKITKQRNVVGNVVGIYRPIYIKLATVQPGERYLMRFEPSTEDEKLRANKVGLAVTSGVIFQHLPELPENITVFEVRSHCKSATIAWYSSPEVRTMSYCIIVLNLPQRNRSSIDYTNYCMDFGKRIVHHPQFHSIKCMEKYKSAPPLESDTIFNLTPGDSYLIYVTANLSSSDGRPLPYQSLRLHMARQCHTLSNQEDDLNIDVEVDDNDNDNGSDDDNDDDDEKVAAKEQTAYY